MPKRKPYRVKTTGPNEYFSEVALLDESEAEALKRMMSNAGLEGVEVRPEDLPVGLAELLDYQNVVGWTINSLMTQATQK